MYLGRGLVDFDINPVGAGADHCKAWLYNTGDLYLRLGEYSKANDTESKHNLESSIS